ncbi:MAG: DUF91 domain-containing protein [Sedimentisphaerales bacterium]|nr:DUF91 domain-containing protein [Sedimentisphaerales bacterium]
MPVEVALWRLGDKPERVDFSPIDAESRLEQILADDPTIIDPNLLLIGRQVLTAYGKFIDLLALDSDGNLIVIELKRGRTPREVVAQLLDYGSWVRSLEDTDIAGIFEEFLKKYYPNHSGTSLDEAFCKKFGVEEMPEAVNESHELVVVAGDLDDSTERIIGYLADEYGVAINAVFFRFFKDGEAEYLSRAWLIDPGEVEAKVVEKREKLPWNGEFYVSFGHHANADGRHWDDARKYNFVSAGGGEWYVRTLSLLEPGGRVWVNIPGRGYVGVGKVLEGPVVVDDFLVDDGAGNKIPIQDAPLTGDILRYHSDSPDSREHLVRVEWLKTVPVSEAIREKGFFGNQNSAAKPRAKRWLHTVERLKKRFEIGE